MPLSSGVCGGGGGEEKQREIILRHSCDQFVNTFL